MDPIQSGNVEQTKKPSLPERIDAVDVSKTDTLAQELAGITNDVNNKIQEAFSDTSEEGAKISKGEASSLGVLKSYLCNLNYKMNSSMQKATENVKNTYQQLIQNVTDLIDRTNSAINGKNPDLVALLEPDEVDAQIYAERRRDAHNVLIKMKEDKARAQSELNSHFNFYGYNGDTPEQIGEKAMSDIANLFLNGRPVESDVNQLLRWAEQQYNSYSISEKNQSWTRERNISLTEKGILEKYAREALVDIKKREAKEQAAANSSQNNAEGSAQEVAESQSGNGFWEEYENVMTEQGHSHDGIADLGVLDYTPEGAEQVLNSDEEAQNKNIGFKQQPIERRLN